ncbi:MAG: tRNA 2-selenouridine(34) synthase MnmH [Campylobacterales bacterium]|nr:tRNA 2-selenouridine(34) synthase MnmH [Campylobacterales bacterium]
MQPIPIETLLESLDTYDLVIDARSPHEYGESRVPGARNFYALSDEEHRIVGTLYKQVSPFEARVQGASYVCVNAASHVKELYPAFTPNAKIAIYCARGGMRSSSLGTIFSSIGYRIDRVTGGYKSYRRFVLDYLENLPKIDFITLAGNTGCGKSDLLQSLENVLDLEKMANHYGSVFGDVNGSQPTQKEFQNRLVHAYRSLIPSRRAFVESESKRIGKITLPALLNRQMAQGFRVEITAPLEQRIERIMRMYDTMDEPFFRERMERISPYISRDDKASAIAAFENNELSRVAEILLTQYYDKVYKTTLRPDMSLCNDDPLKTAATLRGVQEELSARTPHEH